MIVSFKNQASDDIFKGINSTEARKICPQQLWQIAARKLDQLDSVQSTQDLPEIGLRAYPAIEKSEYSIRINEQYRICFMWGQTGPYNVEVTDYH